MEIKEIAECVGLWLAEGDKKTSAEVTFTNNCMELIIFFHPIQKNFRISQQIWKIRP